MNTPNNQLKTFVQRKQDNIPQDTSRCSVCVYWNKSTSVPVFQARRKIPADLVLMG